jgi:hypothetical protein
LVTVTVIDLVTFFGVASFFAWLTYGPLQRDLLEEYLGDEDAYSRARRNFYTANDYFLISFLFYSADIIGEYLLQNRQLFVIGTNPLFNDALLRFSIAILFLGGIITLVAPIWYLRSVQTGYRVLAGKLLPDFRYTLYVSFVTIVGLASTFSGVGILVAHSQWWLALILGMTGSVAPLAGMTLLLAYMFERQREKDIAGFINLLPILVYSLFWLLGYL